MAKRLLLLIVPAIILTQIQFISTALAESQDFTVFDTRKTLALHDGEPVYKDYYTNIGLQNGVKVGSILTVYRKMPVIDIYRNKTQGDLVVAVAHLQVIHAQDTMSVGRVVDYSDRQKIPVMQFEKIMLGDRVELAQNLSKPQDEKE